MYGTRNEWLVTFNRDENVQVKKRGIKFSFVRIFRDAICTAHSLQRVGSSRTYTVCENEIGQHDNYIPVPILNVCNFPVSDMAWRMRSTEI